MTTQDEKFIMFRNRLQKTVRHIGRQARKQQLSVYRVYDHDLPEFPFCIEFYGNDLSVAEYKRQHGLEEAAQEQWLNQSLSVISDVTGIPAERIHLRLRRRKPGREGQYVRQDESGSERVVEENGLRFIVNLDDYLDTGLFADHRVTRQLVRSLAEGKKVLNLFAYTGSFSVYAAAGGASEVVTVDLSNTYLNWAKRNMELNGFTGEVFRFQQADVMQFLAGPAAEKFDIIVVDPPTFSNSQRMKDIFDVQRDHVALLNACLDWLTDSGLVIFSTNSRKFMLDKSRIRASEITDITRATTPFDFEGKFSRWCWKIRK